MKEVIIVLIIFGAVFGMVAMILAMVRDAIRAKAKGKERSEQEAYEAEHGERLARLEERVEVLERIVTDEKYELKSRFREL